jgi:hypothetical protein
MVSCLNINRANQLQALQLEEEENARENEFGV